MQGEGVGVYPGAGVARHHAQLLPQRARAEHGHALPEGDAHRALVDADVRGLGAELDAVNLVAGPERDEADGHEGGARGGAVAERHQRPRRGEVVHGVRGALGARQQTQALHLLGLEMSTNLCGVHSAWRGPLLHGQLYGSLITKLQIVLIVIASKL